MQYFKIRNVLCRSKSFNVIQLIIKETRMCTGNKTVFSLLQKRTMWIWPANTTKQLVQLQIVREMKYFAESQRNRNEWNFTESTFQCFRYSENDLRVYSQRKRSNVKSFLFVASKTEFETIELLRCDLWL